MVLARNGSRLEPAHINLPQSLTKCRLFISRLPVKIDFCATTSCYFKIGNKFSLINLDLIGRLYSFISNGLDVFFVLKGK